MKKLVIQTDFGLVDGAVSAMYGVAFQVNPELKIYDLTHEITPYNIFEASYRLAQTLEYWPSDTVFVSVVDPGVGSTRKSVVAKMNNGQLVVTPDNGTLTHIAKTIGVSEIREISEVKHRRADSHASYTFHGRDVYAFIGAKLAAGLIEFEEVGPLLSVDHIVETPLAEVSILNDVIVGSIDILDVRFGSLWTNIHKSKFEELAIEYGQRVEISIYNNNTMIYQNNVTYGKSFADVMFGAPILYVNSLYCMGLAINQGNFARAYNIGVGANWKIELRKI